MEELVNKSYKMNPNIFEGMKLKFANSAAMIQKGYVQSHRFDKKENKGEGRY